MTTLLNATNHSSDGAGRSKRFSAIPALAAAFTALLIIGCGGSGSGSPSAPATSVPSNPPASTPSAAPQAIAVYAGSAGGKGFVDGPANIAHFGGLAGIIFDHQGNLLVADMDGGAIRKVNPTTGETSTWAGVLGRKGFLDDYLYAARFKSNADMVMASDGTIYMTDSYMGGVRTISPKGLVTSTIGCQGSGSWADGVGPNASFGQPMGIALDEANSILYVTDKNNHVIRRVNIATTETTTLAGVPRHHNEFDYVPSTVDGSFEEARFFFPRAIVGPVEGALYVGCDDSIRKVDLATRKVTTLAGTPGVVGFADGVGANVRFQAISGLAMDGRGHLLITEGGYTNNRCGQVLRSLDLANGQVTTLAGTGSELWDDIAGGEVGLGGWADGIGGNVRFDMPWGIVLDATQSFAYISDGENAVIRKMNLATGEVSTIAGTGPQVGSVDGPAAKAAFNQPFGLALDAQGNAYVADSYNYQIRKITPQGVVSTLAGQAGVGGYADGPGKTAAFYGISDLTVDAKGNVLVADTENNCIRKVTPDGTVSTFAGDPANPGWLDGPAATAQFFQPRSLVLGPDGSLYVADTSNEVIRKITPDGTVSTYAGTVGSIGFADGVGTAAAFFEPYGITKDANGHLLVADTRNHRIRSIDLATGMVTTIAGSGKPGALDGDGSDARFYYPARIVADPRGFLLVSDTNNSAIRKVTYTGTVTTVVGTFKDGLSSLIGIKLGDLPGQITYPAGLAIHPDGSLLALSDNCILKITGIK